jgi:starch synthase
MKIVLDCLSRVSSSRPNKIYKDKFVYTLDENGKIAILYGTDGKSLQYDDTALLNYRRKDVWDLLV